MARGVPNVGNTCWLSAAVQLLCRVPQVARAMLAEALAGPAVLAAAAAGRRGARVAGAFRCVACSYWRSAAGDLLPRGVVRELAEALAAYRPASFGLGAPCDAHEAIVSILEALHEAFREEEEEFAEAPSTGNVDTPAWRAWNARHGLSVFTEIFQVQYSQTYGDERTVRHEWGFTFSGPAEGAGGSPPATLGERLRADFGGATTIVEGKALSKTIAYSPMALLVSSSAGDLRLDDALRLGSRSYELMAAAFYDAGHWTAVARTPEAGCAFAALDDACVAPADAWPRLEGARVCMYRRVQ